MAGGARAPASASATPDGAWGRAVEPDQLRRASSAIGGSSRALRCATYAVLALTLAAAAFGLGVRGIAALLLVVATASTARSWHWLRLARRSSIGARSEQRVRTRLRELEHDGWRVRHSLRWHGGGDVDHIAIAPAVGLAFAIETKTRTYRPNDLARIGAIADWLAKHRSWCRRGAVPVLCLAGSHGIERWEAGVAVVSADRLVPVLTRLAATTRKPRFLR